MARLSDRTLAALTTVAADRLPSMEKLGLLIDQTELTQEDEKLTADSRVGLVRTALRRAREQGDAGDSKAQANLLKFIRLLLKRIIRDPHQDPGATILDDLRETLLGDGYDLRWQSTDPWGPGTSFSVEILPTDTPPISLQDEITALEAELLARGYQDAANNYQQAVGAFTEHRFESANSQLRTMLEDLVMRLATDHANYGGEGRAGEGGQAISHLIDTNALPTDDGGLFLRGLWKMIQPRGPHPGQSDADEARFRLQVVSAAARFLLQHFQSGS